LEWQRKTKILERNYIFFTVEKLLPTNNKWFKWKRSSLDFFFANHISKEFPSHSHFNDVVLYLTSNNRNEVTSIFWI